MADKQGIELKAESRSVISGRSGFRRRRRFTRLSPLTRRIIAVNVAVILVPVLGLLVLGPYRDRLIEQEMEALRTQGEVFSGAVGESAITILANGQEVLNLRPARAIVRRLAAAGNVRARLFLLDGRLAADSQRLTSSGGGIVEEDLPEPASDFDVSTPLDSIVTDLGAVLDGRDYETYVDRVGATTDDFPEAARAMGGEIVGRVRERPGGGLVLSVAVPVQRYYQVFGSLMLSKPGDRIEAAMQEVHLTILSVFLGALVFTVLISLYLAGKIARPLHRLSDAAERVRIEVGREEVEIPDFSARDDEIGDLSVALRDMTTALQSRLMAIEGFAADVAHEIKNPLTSLRSAVETAQRIDNPTQQQALLKIVQEDVDRLDRLITDISEASRVDAELSRIESEEIDLVPMLETLARWQQEALERQKSDPQAEGEDDPGARAKLGGGNPAGAKPAADTPCFELTLETEGPFIIRGTESRLAQVFRNLLGNAASFSPPGGRVELVLMRDGSAIRITCEDDGPGIPEAKLASVFERFYSERPEHEQFGKHSGLGLSISKQIVEAHGGKISAENRKDDRGRILGARFVVILPTA